MVAKDWTFTDNPDDPCAYCVNWEEGSDPMGDDARPVWPDGTTVKSIYRWTHKECNDAILEAYLHEV